MSEWYSSVDVARADSSVTFAGKARKRSETYWWSINCKSVRVEPNGVVKINADVMFYSW